MVSTAGSVQHLWNAFNTCSRLTKVKGFLNLVPYNTCGMLSIHASDTPGNQGEGFLKLVLYNTCGMLSIHASGTPGNQGEGFLKLAPYNTCGMLSIHALG